MEGGAEVGSVDGGVAGGFGVVDVFAFGAVEFHGFDAGEVGEAHWEEGVVLTHDAGTFSEVGFLVFVELWVVYTFC